MIFLAIGLGVLAILVWAGRASARPGAGLQIVCALFAALAAAGAVASGLRGQWFGSLALLALSAYLAQSARGRSPANPRQGKEAMSSAQARLVLGVTPTADREEIEFAYRRLIRVAHPDQGGSSVLAAQLNAARDRLLKPDA